MIRPRTECLCCGTKFTPSSDGETTCGECPQWQRDPTPWDIHGPADGYRIRDRAEYEHNDARSLENYRRVARLRR